MWYEKCDPLFWKEVWPSWQTKPPLLYMNWNFAQKSATQKVWPFVFSWQPSQLFMNSNFAQKSAPSKVWPFGSSWHTRLSQLYINKNFAQKSATWIVWPLGLYELKFCSKKCDMKSVTLGFIWTEILLKKVRH